MLVDITLKVTPALSQEAQSNQDRSLVGHLGTHFDVMDREFPLEYTRREGIVFDVSSVRGRDITEADVDLAQVKPGMFVAFQTGWLGEVGYGSSVYFGQHPQLSDALIDRLLDRQTAIIAVDCGGVRRGREHTPKDQYCAEKGCFVIENLCSLDALMEKGGRFIAHTYPVNFTGVTGLPCRVVAEV